MHMRNGDRPHDRTRSPWLVRLIGSASLAMAVAAGCDGSAGGGAGRGLADVAASSEGVGSGEPDGSEQPDTALPADGWSAAGAAGGAYPAIDAAVGPADSGSAWEAGPDVDSSADLAQGADPEVGSSPPPVEAAWCAAGPLVIDLASAALPATSARVFEPVAAGAVKTSMRVMGVSVGDISGDGRPDLFVGGLEPRILLNCGTAGFVAVPLPPPTITFVFSSFLQDVDGDGRVDIILGGDLRFVQVIRQVAPLVFAPGSFVQVTPDTDAALITTLLPLPQGVLVGRRTWPPDLAFDISESSCEASYNSNRLANPLLPFDEDGLQLGTSSAVPEAVSECWNGPTYSQLYIPRHHLGAPPLIHTSNDFGRDCLVEAPLSAAGGEALALLDSPAWEADHHSMGADFFYEGDRVMLLSSEAMKRPHLYAIGLDGTAEEQPQRLNTGPLYGYRVTWGVAAEDFDGDTSYDWLVAHARVDMPPELMPPEGRAFLDNVDPGGVFLLRGGVPGTDFELDEQAMPPLDGRYFSLVVGDFLGGDGFGDGCPDVFAGQIPDVAGTMLDSSGPPFEPLIGEPVLLACMQPRAFVGVRLPASRRATNAIATLEVDGAAPRHAPVRFSASLAASRDPIANFTLAPGEVPVRLTVDLGDGSPPMVFVDPPTGTYIVIPGEPVPKAAPACDGADCPARLWGRGLAVVTGPGP